MDLKKLVTHFAYKIEAKPEGGFIARATDPTVPAIEAPTRDELTQKIRQNIMSALSTEFPALKDAAEGKKYELSFHVERTPAGGFEIHSADPQTPVVSASNQHDLQSQLVERFLNFAGKHVMPELSQAMAAQAGSGDVKVVFNKKVSFRVNAGSKGITFGASKPTLNAGTQTPQLNGPNMTGMIDGAPITPESNSNWKVFGLLLLVLIAGAAIYFFYHFR